MRVVNEFSNGKILYMFSYESKCSLSPKCLNHINLQDVFIFNFTKLLWMNVFASSDLVVFYENENESQFILNYPILNVIFIMVSLFLAYLTHLSVCM